MAPLISAHQEEIAQQPCKLHQLGLHLSLFLAQLLVLSDLESQLMEGLDFWIQIHSLSCQLNNNQGM
jgi:hypothetical protein